MDDLFGLGVDMGGTVTDGVLLGSYGSVRAKKVKPGTDRAFVRRRRETSNVFRAEDRCRG